MGTKQNTVHPRDRDVFNLVVGRGRNITAVCDSYEISAQRGAQIIKRLAKLAAHGSPEMPPYPRDTVTEIRTHAAEFMAALAELPEE